MNTKNDLCSGLSTNRSFMAFVMNFLVAASLLSGCNNSQSEWQSFGAPISPDGRCSTQQMLENAGRMDSVAVKFEGEIAEVCQMKGCWMTLQSDNGQSIRVTFKDYGFFVPKDASGKKVVIEGIAAIRDLDEATARHYAEDAGQEFDANSNLAEVSVVASGVLIADEDQL